MRCLLVEDDEILGDALRDHLAALGHAADWCLTLGDASIAIQARRFDLVLIDLNLPDGNGLSLLRGLRAANDATPVIVITANDQISDRMSAVSSGARDYLVKPFDLSTLTNAIFAVRCEARTHFER